MESLLMGLVGYSGKGSGNIVDKAFCNVILFYWFNYFPLNKFRRLFMNMDAEGAVRMQ
jgi:hypothetical protein